MSEPLQRLPAPPRSGLSVISTSPSQELPAPLARYPVEEPEPAGNFELRDYWRVLHARRWTVLWAVAVALSAAMIYNYVATPTFRASSTIQIDREEPAITGLDDEYARSPEQPDYIETQYRILKSRSLARRVIRKLGLGDLPEFARNPGAGPAAVEEPADAQNPIRPSVVDAFLDRLSVDPGKGTRLVTVRFESVHRSLAPAVVNSLAEEYIEHNLEAKWKATQKASAWLQQQLSTLKAKLEASEGELRDYATKHSILFVEERKDITSEKMAQLEDELTRAETDRIQKQSLAILAEEAVRTDGALPGSLNSAAYEEFRRRRSELRRGRSELLVTFAPGYPKVQRIQQQIHEIDQSIEAEEGRLLKGVQESFQLALKREQLLRDAATHQRRLVNRLSDDFIQYNILKRDAETNRELYEGLLQRLKEAGVTAGLRASNIAVVDPAELPERPYRPKKLLNLSLGLAAGLLLGAGLAFLQEHLSTVVHTPDEVEQLTGLSLLAVIPRSRRGKGKRLVTAPLIPGGAGEEIEPSAPCNGDGGGRDEAGAPAPLRWDPEQALAEAYRTLRSSVLLGCDESLRRILVTSSQPEEGKTSVSLNLACSLAQLGRRVLAIDADMRRPVCEKLLHVRPESGLTDYLQGLADINQVIVETPLPGLSLIAGGRSSAAAPDLLYSPRLKSLLREVGARYDHVVVDSPPSLVLADARTISRLVEGVLLVVSEKTDRGALLRTKQTLEDAGVRLLGFVMNRIDLNSLACGYYRGYGYDYSDSVSDDS